MGQVFESAYQWNVYSSDGRIAFGGNLLRPLPCSTKGDEWLLTELSISGLWIDRATEVISFEILKKEFAVSLPQVVLSKHKLADLVDDLDRWLQSAAEVSVSLCASHPGEQELRIHIGPPVNERRLEETIMTVEYSGIGFTAGKWSFEIDQSCVRIFRDELRNALQHISMIHPFVRPPRI